MVRTIDGDIIVADDDGEVLTDRDDDRVDPDDEGVELLTDGGKPPGEDVHIATNFDKGGVWFRLGDRPRKLLSPDDARALADEVGDRFDNAAFDAAGYDSTAFVDGLREAADDAEDAVPDPDHDDFDDVPLPDGGRPPLSSFDHAPTVGPSDVDKCGECGRYAPHAFDHAPDCSRFVSIDDELSSRTAASNTRMVRPATDGGTTFDKPPKRPEQIASSIVASSKGDDVAVYCSHDGTLSIYEGEVVSTGYQDAADGQGGTHVVAIDVAGDRVAVHFDRTIDFDADGNLATPDPVLFDPVKGARLPVTRFDGVDV